jgi:hypothetical protein
MQKSTNLLCCSLFCSLFCNFAVSTAVGGRLQKKSDFAFVEYLHFCDFLVTCPTSLPYHLHICRLRSLPFQKLPYPLNYHRNSLSIVVCRVVFWPHIWYTDDSCNRLPEPSLTGTQWSVGSRYRNCSCSEIWFGPILCRLQPQGQ